jgi:hypothetical protein
MISGYHDLYLGSRSITGFTLRFSRLPVAVVIASGAQVVVFAAKVVVPDICQI